MGVSTQSTWGVAEKMVFATAATVATVKTVAVDSVKVYKLLVHMKALTDTSSPEACQSSVEALDAKVRSHMGLASLASKGLEHYNKDPVTYGVKKYLTHEGCTF